MRRARTLLLALATTVALVAPAAAQAQAPACPCTIFAPTDGPTGDAIQDAPIEVGVKFRSDEDGYITALRFYKQPNNTGNHVGHLWSASGTLLAEATFAEETASGWQEAPLAEPVAVTAGAIYVASYFSAGGRFAWSPGGLGAGVDRPPLHALADGVAGGNGVYHSGGSGFPASTFNATNYWVDAVFERGQPVDTRPPAVTAVAPAPDAKGVAVSSKVTASFDEALDPASVNVESFTLRDSAGAAVAASVAYDGPSRKATLTPTAPLTLGQTYTATIAGAKDTAGNAMAGPRTWSFSTPPSCPCTIFGPSDTPSGDAIRDQPLEVGMRFRSTEAGVITALRFYKQPNNTGTHVGHLWTGSGQLLAEVPFTDETASGWQEAVLPQPVPIAADTSYVTSYHSSAGYFAWSPGYFDAPRDRSPLIAPAASFEGGNGVYRMGPSGFPDSTFGATNYWTDVVFERGTAADTRGPRVSSVSPAAGAAAVPADTKVTATFDEAVDRLTVNTGSFILGDGANAVPATVAYDEASRTATLTPSAPLTLGKTYTATVKSGSGGVTDTAGNQMTADRAWTFSTASQCPCTVFRAGEGPTGDAVRDQPAELGMKFRATEDGYITRLRFYKQANNTGTHVGHVWSGTGQLLASATFTNETASGWQEVELPNPIAITRATTYVVSYYSSAGYFAWTPGYFGATLDRAPMQALGSGVDGPNGVYRYGASGFPTESFNATNYWVDAAFERTVPPDTRGPAVTAIAPVAGAKDAPRTVNVTASFDEALDPATVTPATFTLRAPDGTGVPAAVTYDPQTRVATLDPTGPLPYDTALRVSLKGGAGGVTDVAHNPLAADKTWTFNTVVQPPGEGPGGPILVVASPGDPFTRYYAEILRAEGLNAFAVEDGPVTAQQLSGKSLVLLGSAPVTDAEVSTLSTWVQGGGNLIAVRPDKKLAPLLGLTPTPDTLANGYVRVDTGSVVGKGIDAQTLQFHGTADRYTAGQASPVATLYSSATTATSNPAVTLRSVGTTGGQAAAFAYDLARSVAYTRQGNPAWSGQKRDGTPNGRRANDLFYGAKAGDIQPDWVDPNRIDVPQADEQQRLLANLITEMTLDKAPMPRFWYLPRGEKAAVVMTGDDHAVNGTPAYFDRFKTTSPAGCSVEDWECARATSYVYPDTPMTPAQVAAYQQEGFEIALHLNTGCADFTAASLDQALTTQLGALAATFPGVDPPVSNRTHCIVWSDWATGAKVQRDHGIRFDTNYYYNGPAGWLKKPGLLTGSGFPMRFADLDGTLIDAYQSMTQVTDESDMAVAPQLHALLDNALGAKGYYGVFNVNMHTDYGDHNNANDLAADALRRGVPVVSSAQMLDWLDGRNGSAFSGIAYDAGKLRFSVVAGPKARGLEAMVPARSAAGPLARITRDGRPVSWERRTVKGTDYVVFDGVSGAYEASYATDTIAPDISEVVGIADGDGHATVTWRTDEPADSVVEYGRTSTLGYEQADGARVTRHEVELTGLTPNSTYAFRVRSTDTAGNAAASPTETSTASFATQPGALVDSRASEFAAGTKVSNATYTGQTLDGSDGEVILRPTIGEEFAGSSLPADWLQQGWGAGGFTSVARGTLTADGGVARAGTAYAPPKALDFAATFEPVNDQVAGFGEDFSNFPLAAFTTGNRGEKIQLYAWSANSGETETKTPLPGVVLGHPHRFRVEWNAADVVFYVDGVRVAAHTVTIPGPMRPAASDYGIFGAGVHVHWFRQSTYPTNGTFLSRVLDGGPGANQWQLLSSQQRLPLGTGITFETRSGGTAQPDGSWSAFQPVGSGGAIASPPARFIQYRARLSRTSAATPVLERVQLSYGPGTDAAPVAGTVALAPASPATNQTLIATPSGFTDADGDPLTYHYQWLRNETPIAGATGSQLDLAAAGNGDRGDVIRVSVYATDGKGAASDPATRKVTVANTAPTAGSVSVAPSAPATNDVLAATPSGFADVDSGTLSYRYQWYRNGAPITGATSRTLDLALAGNGDAGETVAVDVWAIDAQGAESPAARGAQTITGANATPVAGTLTLSPEAPRTDQTVTVTPSGFRDPDGEPLTYRYQWLRNGTAISGATSPTLDLSVAGRGDRGDVLRVEVSAADPGNRRSDTVTATLTVANTSPTAGSVTVKPVAPATNDILTATASSFADLDGDAISYAYQWSRNGTDIPGATSRTIDLSEPGHGDLGDLVGVEVTALDGQGGTSPAARDSQTVNAVNSKPIAAYGFEEAAGTIAADSVGGNDGAISGAARTDAGRFGRALSFDGEDDIVTVPDSPSLRLTTGMTVEAWVRPTAATYWRTVVFKESNGGLGYSLYSNADGVDVPSAHVSVNGDIAADGSSDLDPGQWSHLAATYDGSVVRLYVNGALAGSKATPGELPTAEGPLTFGANNVWGERFRGLIDEVRVYNRRLSGEEIAADLGRPVVAGTPAPPADTAAEAIGTFSKPQAWPMTPVHLALLSNGRVAAWDGFDAALNSEHVWNPATGNFDAVPNGRNLFCAGHITLPDGRLLVAGGHVNAYEGIKDTNLFTPKAGTWARGADMSVARWYPTTTSLPDGRVFVVSGDAITLGQPDGTTPIPFVNASRTLPEIYDPATDKWTAVPSGTRKMPLYPYMFVLPDGRLFDAGPDTMTRTFDIATGQWTQVGDSGIDGQSAVMYRPGKILKSGTWSDPEFPGRAVTDRSVAIDMTQSSPAWRDVARMKYKRAYHTLTVLPDGTVLSTGGQTATDGVDQTTGILAAELWDPETDKWTTMASSRRPRLYHSSALLLPDGRVLLAGGGAYGNARNEASAEIYSPPYLFKGRRPSVTAAPDALHYGQSFSVETPDAARIRSASLVRMGSVTHNFDMDQRYMALDVQAQGDQVTLSGPPNRNVAPPGYYMVFLKDDKGVPSEGQIVRIADRGDTQPPTAPAGLVATPRPDGADLDWEAAMDNTGVDEYRVYRSTSANFTPSSANRIARVADSFYIDRGAPAGTHYYKVRAVDEAGNAGPTSSEVAVVVPGDTTAPAVSVTAPAGGAALSGTVTLAANATDAAGVRDVRFRLDGEDVGAADATSPYSVTWDTRDASDGRHVLTAVARDASGNTATSAGVAITVHNTGLVASYGFEEAAGATAVDPVGGHDGQIVGATRTPEGRFGNALSFDGVDDWVTIPHHAALDLNSGMTVEAWVKPSLLSSWRSVMLKERPGALDYGLYASTDAQVPAGRIAGATEVGAAGPLALGVSTWTHLALTWDGAVARLFVDGAEVATQDSPGPLVSSTGALRIGGSSVRSEWFSGSIDEIRLYRRALTAPEITVDLGRAVRR